MKGISRRQFGKRLGTALALGSAGSLLSYRAWAQKEPIKIAVVQDMSKVYGLIGKEHIRGLELALEEAGNEVAGRSFKIIVEDTQADPATGLSKAKKVIGKDRPQFFLGPIASRVYAAVVGTVLKAPVIWFAITQGAGGSRVVELCGRNVFSTSWNVWPLSYPFAAWAKQNIAGEFYLGYADYNWGQLTGQIFKEGFEKAGGKIVGTIAPPLGTADFAPYLTRLLKDNPPAIWCFFAGGDAVTFVKQFDQFGLKGKVKLTAQGFMVEEEVLPAQGESAVGVISVLHWALRLDNPANTRFKESYKKKWGVTPSAYSLTGYDTGRIIVQALQETKGETKDLNRLIRVVENMKIDSPRGPMRFDPRTHDVIQNMYVREVRMVDGRPNNVVIDQLKDIEIPLLGCNLQKRA